MAGGPTGAPVYVAVGRFCGKTVLPTVECGSGVMVGNGVLLEIVVPVFITTGVVKTGSSSESSGIIIVSIRSSAYILTLQFDKSIVLSIQKYSPFANNKL